MAEQKGVALALPAIRAHMGDWIFYVSVLKMRDVAARISIAEDIHTTRSLRELLQRRLTDRSKGIGQYLLKQKQRFFNALVIATYGGAPTWNELGFRDLDPSIKTLLEPLEGALGILTLTGSEKLFAVDGQHRVAGIRAALESRKAIGDEEVAVILVAGVTQEHRPDDQIGFERTRRLFTILNRYAKPVSKRDIIALDEDDVVAILTRRLVEEHPLFRDKVSSRSVNSLPPTDRDSFTTITAIYDALDTYLPATRRGWGDLKKLRPPDSVLSTYYRRAVGLWGTLITGFPPLRAMNDSMPGDGTASRFRGNNGGHLLFRPIGILLVVRVIERLTEEGITLREAVRRAASIQMDLAAAPWVGLLWDDTNHRMITTGENQRVAERLLLYLVGGDLTRMRSSPDRLRIELAGVLNRPEDEISLPQAWSS